MSKHIKQEEIEKLAKLYANEQRDFNEAFFAYKVGFEKAMELMGRRPRHKVVDGVKYKLRNKKS